MVMKEHMEKINPKVTKNEEAIMWHGTHPDSVDNILSNDMNRLYKSSKYTDLNLSY